MLYHISQKADLKILKPFISSHGKAYVYAIENLAVGLLFGVKKDDFDFLLSTDEKMVTNVYECYPNAFEKIYWKKDCSVYEVEESGFQRGMTSWEPELVCENEVAVVREIKIENIYQRLLEEEQKGSLVIHRYQYNDEYRKMIAAHVVDRLVRFHIDLDRCMEQDHRFATYYKELIQGLLVLMDGHLLQ